MEPEPNDEKTEWTKVCLEEFKPGFACFALLESRNAGIVQLRNWEVGVPSAKRKSTCTQLDTTSLNAHTATRTPAASTALPNSVQIEVGVWGLGLNVRSEGYVCMHGINDCLPPVRETLDLETLSLPSFPLQILNPSEITVMHFPLIFTFMWQAINPSMLLQIAVVLFRLRVERARRYFGSHSTQNLLKH